MNCTRPIQRLPWLLPALLSIAIAAASPASGQETNIPGQPAAVGTNRPKKFTPPSSNSVAFAQTKARAEKGEAAAQSELGSMYDFGQGVTQDYAEAVKWLGKAAEQGHPRAQLLLGLHYQNGDGVRQDYAEAVKWLRKAADQGGAQAQYSLGVCYDRGHGVAQDFAEAVKWYRKAAGQGDPMAQYNLGLCYARGNGVPQDYVEAVKWYRKAAEQGELVAMTGGEPRSTTPRRQNGSMPRRNKAMRRHNTALATCMTRARACRRIMSRPTSGTDSLPTKMKPMRFGISTLFRCQ